MVDLDGIERLRRGWELAFDGLKSTGCILAVAPSGKFIWATAGDAGLHGISRWSAQTSFPTFFSDQRHQITEPDPLF